MKTYPGYETKSIQYTLPLTAASHFLFFSCSFLFTLKHKPGLHATSSYFNIALLSIITAILLPSTEYPAIVERI